MKNTKRIPLTLTKDFLGAIDEYNNNTKQGSRESLIREAIADHIDYQLTE